MGMNKPAKRKYRPTGSGKRNIDGPGIWASCIKGKERQTIGELCDLFESLASELWPTDAEPADRPGNGASSIDDGLSIEALVAQEIATIKQPRKVTESRFINCHTNTPCVVFIACRTPVDPVKLVLKHVENVQRTGVKLTRYTHRLVPVSGTCNANLKDIHDLGTRVIDDFFLQDEKKYSYKIELRIRNHNTYSRAVFVQSIAECMPEGHTVDLTNPEIFILVEVFKSFCGISVVKDYYKYHKFNVTELSNALGVKFQFGEGGRVSGDGQESREIKAG